MKRSVEVSGSRSSDHAYLNVELTPKWARWLDDAAEWLCTATGHRWCHLVYSRAYEVVDRHTETFKVPVDRGRYDEYLRFRGWDHYITDDEDE